MDPRVVREEDFAEDGEKFCLLYPRFGGIHFWRSGLRYLGSFKGNGSYDVRATPPHSAGAQAEIYNGRWIRKRDIWFRRDNTTTLGNSKPPTSSD